jgi:hypothetical protein
MSDQHHKEKSDALERALEAQNHRYDPGYYMGGQINLLISARRPN